MPPPAITTEIVRKAAGAKTVAIILTLTGRGADRTARQQGEQHQPMTIG